MTNIVAKFPGSARQTVAITGHYDTKMIPGVRFVGANDAGSSTGLLLELARTIAKTKHRNNILIVFFDGEEAVGEWSDTDSVYGSRHLATKWLADRSLARLKALINVDMIGDKDLDILNDGNSSSALRLMLAQVAAKLGYQKHLRTNPSGIEDDHKPFADVGVNVLDIIDFSYGPNQSYWHTALDTMDKLSAQSLQITGDLVLGLIAELDSK